MDWIVEAVTVVADATVVTDVEDVVNFFMVFSFRAKPLGSGTPATQQARHLSCRLAVFSPPPTSYRFHLTRRAASSLEAGEAFTGWRRQRMFSASDRLIYLHHTTYILPCQHLY